MEYIVIGLGNYGYMLAEELASAGHEVIGVDRRADRTERIKDRLAASFIMDATDASSLTALPLHTVDAVIVAIGADFGASVRITALLKQAGVKHICARANDEVHRSILQAFDIDRILEPETDAARSLVQTLEFGYDMETFRIDDDYAVVRFTVPGKLAGYTIRQLSLAEEFHLRLLAAIRGRVQSSTLGIKYTQRNVVSLDNMDFQLQTDDRLVVFGRYADFRKFLNAI